MDQPGKHVYYTAPDLKPSQSKRDAPCLAWVIDATAGGAPDPRQRWENPWTPPGTKRPRKPISAIADKHARQPVPGGSWNIPVVAMADRAFMENGSSDWEMLGTYCDNQLGKDGLWGEEILSAEYFWPPVVLALCLQVANDPNSKCPPDMKTKLQNVIDAHALLLALCALPYPHQEKDLRTGFNFHVCAPGIRNDKPFAVGVWRDYWLGCMLRPPKERPPVPRWFNNQDHGNWPARVTRVVQTTASDDVGSLIRPQLSGGSLTTVQAIVNKMKTLGVHLTDLGTGKSIQLHIQRRPKSEGYPQGTGCAWFDHDLPVPTKPPTMAESSVSGGGGNYQTLHVHPAGFNAPPPNGKATCVLADGDFKETVQDLMVGGKPATGTVPVPAGEPVYHLQIDNTGPQVL